MNRIVLSGFLSAGLGLQAQSWDLALGLSNSYLERYGPYSGPSSPLNSTLTVGFSRPIFSNGGSRHQFRTALTAAPRRRDGIFSYGYISAGAYYVGTTNSGRFSWTGGLSFRREAYRLSGYRLIDPSDPVNPTLLTPDVDGSMTRPYLGAGIAYTGFLVPFQQNGRVRLTTRFMLEKVLYTPRSLGWEDTLRRALNQEQTATLQAGVQF